MHHAKNRGNKEIPLAILSRILAQSCVTPPYIISGKGLRMIVQGNPLRNTIKDTSTIMRNPSLHNFRQRVTHDCASVLDSIATGISLFPRFFAWCILASSPGLPRRARGTVRACVEIFTIAHTCIYMCASIGVIF